MTRIIWKQIYNPLKLIIFIKEKMNIKIKARDFSDGSNKRGKITKYDVEYTMLEIKLVLITCTTDSHEAREIVINDIPGEYLSY